MNGRPTGERTPILSAPEWAWGDATLLQPADPAPNDAQPATYLIRSRGRRRDRCRCRSSTRSTRWSWSRRGRFGWTSSARWWQDSRGHGYCAPDADNFFFRSIFHPRDSGYEAKAAGLMAEAELLGVVPH